MKYDNMSWNHPGGPRGGWSMPYGYGAPYGGYGHWGGPPGPRPPPGFGPRPPYWGPGGVSSSIFDLHFHGKMILNEIIYLLKIPSK